MSDNQENIEQSDKAASELPTLPPAEKSKLKLADVALPIPSFEPFTYYIPQELAEQVKLGSWVTVPFMKGMKTGVVIGFPASTELEKVREIADLADNDPPAPPNLLELCKWISDYYVCPIGEVLAAAHPAGMLAESKKAVQLKDDYSGGIAGLEGYSQEVEEIFRRLKKCKPLPLSGLRKDYRRKGLLSLLMAMEKRGILEIVDSFPGAKYRPQRIAYIYLNPELTEDYLLTWLNDRQAKSPKQAALVRFLQGGMSVTRKTLMTETGVSSSVIKTLLDRGLLREKYREVIRDTAVDFGEEARIVHTEQQKAVISSVNQAFDRKEYAPFLLFGVTGSGKTEVYMEVISHCLQAGKTAMVLVPEIALTPQIASRFRHRFGGQIVIQHSRISRGERYDSWRRLATGRARVVIGARSALFAPLQNLGLIIVDEEHEHSFKQVNRPHYSARDCAVWLAKKLNIPIVLGSATPAVETYYNAQQGKYKMLELPERVAGGKFSEFHLVDLTEDSALISGTSISPLLLEKIEDRLRHGEKTIILQNRRGFSPFIKCKLCGAVEQCENCSVTLTYHITNRRLRCHLCGFQKIAPVICGKCGGSDLKYCGVGTQRVEEDLAGLFPDAQTVRMDLDTTAAIDSHFKILEAFAQGKYDILLGTQMVAKGLDFPQVTLVGIISADTELLRPDFRAEERTFRLLVQAAGRSGRHRPGEVVVQTYNPKHPIFNLVRHNDYISFYQKTARERQGLRYPPFGRLIKLSISGPQESKVAEAASYISQMIPRTEVRILGPSPALLAKVKRKYYYNLLLKTDLLTLQRLAAIKRSLLEVRESALQKYRGDEVGLEIDVDPLETL